MITLYNGITYATHEKVVKCDLLIENYKIIPNGQPDKIVEADHLIAVPGGLDPHTHMELPVMGTFSSDDFKVGTQKALLGGTTSIIDFANQSKGESLHVTLDKWLEKSKKAVIPVYFHVSITDVTERTLKEIPEVMKRGVNSFKVFLAYKNMMLNDTDLRKVMKACKENGATLLCHCEMGEEIEKNIARFKAEGKLHPKFHALSRPSHLEAAATKHFLDLAIEEGCLAYVVHISCAGAVDALRSAKKKSKNVFGETCPQYLTLDDSLYEQNAEEACNYILSPPLRKKSDQDAIWRGIFDGTIDTLATDHCPFTHEQKLVGVLDFTKIPNGLGGVGERMNLFYKEGVLKRKMSLTKYVELTSYNASKIFNRNTKNDSIAFLNTQELLP